MDFGAVEDVAHFPGQAVGFVNAANLGIAKAGAQQTGKLSITVDAFIIHFDDEDVVEAGENVFQAMWQWVDVAKVESGNAVSCRASAVHRFVNWTLGRSPTDNQHDAFGRSIDFRR